MLVETAHFPLPHSGNGPAWCQLGLVLFDTESKRYVLGLQFSGGKKFAYPAESYETAEEVLASAQGYASVSWAANPKSRYYDARFSRYIKL